jgi:hypothetical protein
LPKPSPSTPKGVVLTFDKKPQKNGPKQDHPVFAKKFSEIAES